MYVDSLIEDIGPPDCVHTIECEIANQIRKGSSISFEHVSL